MMALLALLHTFTLRAWRLAKKGGGWNSLLARGVGGTRPRYSVFAMHACMSFFLKVTLEKEESVYCNKIYCTYCTVLPKVVLF